jgi:hypothetical protein
MASARDALDFSREEDFPPRKLLQFCARTPEEQLCGAPL